MECNNYFEKSEPINIFFKCAIPAMFSMMFMSLYTMIDGFFVGKFLGEDSLVAINLFMPIIMISFALADMIAVGSSVQMAIKLGEKNEEDASKIFSLSAMVILIFSIIVGGMLLFFIKPILQLMGAESKIISLAADCSRVYGFFSPLIVIFFAIDNYLRICGRANYSMVANIIVAILNIILDYIFIVKLKLGISSVALATSISLATGTIICITPFILNKLQLHFVKPIFSFKIMKDIVINGSSEFFSNISSSVFMIIINAILLNLYGSTSVAVFSIIMYIEGVVSPMIYGIADAMQPSISYNYGAKNMERVKRLEGTTLLGGFLFSIMILIFIQFNSENLISIFVEKGNSYLLEMGIVAIKIYSLSYIARWAPTICGSFFTALNKPVISLVITFANSIIFPLVAVTVLVPVIQLKGIWLSPFMSGVMGFLLCIALLFSIKRKGEFNSITLKKY
ncbi:MATE family efflux transporter [Terrisporobacter glycolicus]|uniref:MATE family efflux transporter n=1 Tax=Terrisporobacter glycolicus TaxID=36841 RepID=UPI000ADC6748